MTMLIAFRNIFRNFRRSAVTVAAICVGVVSLILFGAFMAQVVLGFQTSTVQRAGHLTLFKRGYFESGSGNPGAYGIAGYRAIMAALKQDGVLAPMLNVVTPSVILQGVAGHSQANTSRTFFGMGVLPGERNRMRVWDEYRLMDPAWRRRVEQPSGLLDEDPSRSLVGVGLARMLGLCERSDAECVLRSGPGEEDRPRISVLAAAAGGAPNIVNLAVSRAVFQGFKDIDDNFIAMHLQPAQELMFGRGETDKVSSIVIQLRRTEDLVAARERLQQIIDRNGWNIEVRDFAELTPMYAQAQAMFRGIFGFIGLIMAVIVLFITANTMNMNVMERLNEIGVLRAMGMRRMGVRRQFLAEGLILGCLGAAIGMVLAAAAGAAFNGAGLTWTPPGQVNEIPLKLLLAGAWQLFAFVGLAMVALGTLAALVPANQAARMRTVDALRA